MIDYLNQHRSVALALVFILAYLLTSLYARRKSRHARKIQTADFILKRIHGFSEAQKIAYLRKVDPYAFEELIMTCLERKGFPIRRNERYSGDGGIDGRFFVKNEMHLIQAKRYTGEIRYSHLEEFADLLSRQGCKGIFVHTGKTPRNVEKRQIDLKDITVISGSRLIRLLDTEIKKQL